MQLWRVVNLRFLLWVDLGSQSRGLSRPGPKCRRTVRHLYHAEEEAVAAVERARKLDRREVRRAFERRFTARRMAEEYVRLYDQLTGSSEKGIRRSA